MTNRTERNDHFQSDNRNAHYRFELNTWLSTSAKVHMFVWQSRFVTVLSRIPCNFRGYLFAKSSSNL